MRFIIYTSLDLSAFLSAYLHFFFYTLKTDFFLSSLFVMNCFHCLKVVENGTKKHRGLDPVGSTAVLASPRRLPLPSNTAAKRSDSEEGQGLSEVCVRQAGQEEEPHDGRHVPHLGSVSAKRQLTQQGQALNQNPLEPVPLLPCR